MIRILFAAMLLCAVALCQPTDPPQNPPANSGAAIQLQPPVNANAQMRTDLNQMESLLNNMGSEVTFLRDQNLQILLNTNLRMWSILIRDLRLQLDEREGKANASPMSNKPAPKPSTPQP